MQFELISYKTDLSAPDLVPASRDCVLFDDNPHAVRCLPLSIANTMGWEILCPDGVTIEWNGGPGASDLTVTFDNPYRWASSKTDRSRPQPFAKSHFQTGIVTFEPGRLFKTPPGWALMATGKPNHYRDGIAPLTGVIETEWVDYSFTMNWKMTRPGTVRFEKGEAFCFITPVQIAAVIDVQPIEHNLADHPELSANVRAGGAERDKLMARMVAGDPEARKHPWGRRYWLGQQPEGSTAPAPQNHVNKIRTKAPIQAAPREATAAVFDANGRFTPSTKTRIVRSAADAVGLDFLVVDQLLSAEQCAALRDLYDRYPDLYEQGHMDGMWNNRLLGMRGLKPVDPAGAALMQAATRAAIARVAGFYQPKAPLYADVVHLTRWQTGQHMPVRADNVNPDGSVHPTAHRSYSGLYYLTDDFEGGGLYLPNHDVLIQPAAGMFVSLPAGVSHALGVVRVDCGDRYTLPFFLTHDRARADRLIHPEAAPVCWTGFSAAPVNLAVRSEAEPA